MPMLRHKFIIERTLKYCAMYLYCSFSLIMRYEKIFRVVYYLQLLSVFVLFFFSFWAAAKEKKLIVCCHCTYLVLSDGKELVLIMGAMCREKKKKTFVSFVLSLQMSGFRKSRFHFFGIEKYSSI